MDEPLKELENDIDAAYCAWYNAPKAGHTLGGMFAYIAKSLSALGYHKDDCAAELIDKSILMHVLAEGRAYRDVLPEGGLE